MKYNIIPVAIQFKMDGSQLNITLGMILNESTGSATALLHFGFDEDTQFSFDLMFLQGILTKFT